MLLLGPIELISPILSFQNDQWRAIVREAWTVVGSACEISTSDECGTHVHVSPINDENMWDMDALKNICVCILYFEGAIDVMLPEERLGNAFAMSHRMDNFTFVELTMDECFDLIHEQQTVQDIVILMANENQKNFGWNFLNLTEDFNRTIEFRRAPGVTDVEDAMAWVEFAITFLCAAAKCSRTDLELYGKDVAELRELIENEVGAANMGLMDRLFEGKSGWLRPRRAP